MQSTFILESKFSRLFICYKLVGIFNKSTLFYMKVTVFHVKKSKFVKKICLRKEGLKRGRWITPSLFFFWQTSSSVLPRPSQPYLPFKKNMKVNSAFIMKKLVFYPIYNYWPPSRYLPPKHKLCNHLDSVQFFVPHF